MKHKGIGRQRGNGVAMAWQRAIRGTTEAQIRLETWAVSQLGQAFPSHRGKYPDELSKALLEAYLKSRFWRVSATCDEHFLLCYLALNFSHSRYHAIGRGLKRESANFP